MNTKRKARKSSDSSTSGNSPAEKRAREIFSSPNPSPERAAEVNSEVVEVVEMPENLESKVGSFLRDWKLWIKSWRISIPQSQTWRVNSTNWKVELRSSKMLNRPRGTPLERWKMVSRNSIHKLMKLKQPVRK